MSLPHTSDLDGALVRADHSCWEIVFSHLWYRPDDGFESATHAALFAMACRTMDSAAQHYIAHHPYRFPTFALRVTCWEDECIRQFKFPWHFHQRCVPFYRRRAVLRASTTYLITDFDRVSFIAHAQLPSRLSMVGTTLDGMYLVGGKILPDPRTNRFRDFDVVPVQKLERIECKRRGAQSNHALVWEGKNYTYMSYATNIHVIRRYFNVAHCEYIEVIETHDVNLDFTDPDAVRIVRPSIECQIID